MAPHLLLANWKFLGASNTTDAVRQFASQRIPIWEFISNHASEAVAWISQPHILMLITVWWITFTIIVTLVLCLGFGPFGVIPGSLAAAFQAWAYGGLTPAGGIFATLTSLGMVGFLAPPVAAFGAGVATATTFVAWLCQ